MKTAGVVAEYGICPGCHFGCKLDAYQCGRGREFFELAESGQPLPERRWPMFTPSELAAGRDKLEPPLDERVMHGLNIAANALRDRHEKAGARKVVAALARGGSFMSIGILSKRTQIPLPELDTAIADAQAEGLAYLDEEEHGGTVVRLTAAGAEQAEAWEQERARSTADFLAPLSDGDKEQLDHLLHKILEPYLGKRRKGGRHR